jgi:FAD dependent oxidoreductase
LAAAVAASRVGLSVLLVEKYGFCGGATVAGLSGSICGLFSSGSHPQQIAFGFAAEFHDLMASRGGVGEPLPFGKTLLVPHESVVWKELADYLLRQQQVRILYHTQFLRAFQQENRIDALLVQAKEGQAVIQPKVVVDASGDAEVVHSLSGETTLGRKGLVQTPTMIFRMGGVDIEAFLKLDPAEIDRKIVEAHKSGAFCLPRHHVYLFPMPNGHEVLCNMTRITRRDGSVPLGISSDDISFAEVEGRIQARSYATFLRERIPAFAHAYLADTGAQVGIRQTRSIVGKARLTNDNVLKARKVKGAATLSAWPIEIHSSEGVGITFIENDYYDIPFETLVPLVASNLLVAGRCMSAEHEALASARVTAQCFGMGYAVGAACGLLARENLSAQELSGEQVADWMHAQKLRTAKER